MAFVPPQAVPRHVPRAAASGSSTRLIASVVALAMLGAVSQAAAANGGCSVPPDLIKLQEPLPRLLAAVNAHEPIRIVALGSSSTAGTGASSRAHSYPARLEKELRTVWPNNDVRVINAGVAGQLARHMVARIDKHVAPHKPQLVIWQTGVNDAIRGVPIETLKQELRTGIARFRAMGADVVLVNHQFYPRYKKVRNGPLYLSALREVAGQLDVPVMRRFAIMEHLIESAQFTPATLLSSDQFHLNDRSYDCMGRLLAQSLRSAASPAPSIKPPSASVPAVAAPEPPTVQKAVGASAPLPAHAQPRPAPEPEITKPTEARM